jgi:2-polyprenyl-6-methoxyphenol hydroxylase-like FAD-dependent oxidoreductase
MPISKVIILGGGIAGVAAAIALTKFNNLTVQVFELRAAPATIGGAINLTPVAMRYLAHLGVADKLIPLSCETPRIDIYALRTAKKIGEIDYDNVERFKFRGRRVLRAALMDALLETFAEVGGSVEYGKRAESITVTEQGVEVTFVGGGKANGDILIGADGIHSFTRSTVIEPERKPVYTGIAGAYGLVDTSLLSKPLPTTTGMFSGRKGSWIMSYYDAEKTKVYTGGVMETPEAESREGWKVKNGAKAGLRADMTERFGKSPETVIDEILEKTEEWFLFPVFKLPPRGKWFNERCLLIGDAAHAVSSNLPCDYEYRKLTLADATSRREHWNSTRRCRIVIKGFGEKQV